MEAAHSDTAYAGTGTIRKLGRGLRRRRRLRVGITQLFYVLAGVGLGLLIPQIPVGFTVPRAETVQMLFAVGAGLLTFIGVIFSLLFLVVQFGSTTFTPRLNLFYTAPIVWHAFGVLHRRARLLVRRRLQHRRRGGSDGLVPIVIDRAPARGHRPLSQPADARLQLGPARLDAGPGHAARAPGPRRCVSGQAADRGGRAWGPRAMPDGRREVVWTGGPGVIQAIDVPRIIVAAPDADAAVEIVVPIGETVHRHAPVAVVHGTADSSLDSAVLKSIRTGVERTFEQDPALAFRVLVDIALRALSPAINDPTTASQVLDSVESLLRTLVGRDLDVGVVTGPHGSARVLLPLPDWADYVVAVLRRAHRDGRRPRAGAAAPRTSADAT